MADATSWPSIRTLVTGIFAVWTVLIGPRWWSAVLVAGMSIQQFATDRLVYWLKQHVAALQECLREAADGR